MFFFIRKIVLVIVIIAISFGLYRLWKYKPKEKTNHKSEWDDF